MVISNLLLRKDRCIAIALVVIAILFLGNTLIVEAKIDDAQLKQIKMILEITNSPFSSNYSEEQLKEILNKALKPDEPDINYGILILSSWNEIEFMDMVLSQGYKKQTGDYFNQLLDAKLSLANHLKSVGQDIYKVISRGEVAANPVFALTLNTFSMTNKVVEIFIAFNALRDIKKYDGLWYYFNLRKQGNEPHEVAWDESKEIMGFVAKPSFPFRGINKINEKDQSQLELQFANLWDKWGLYATPFGISEEAKAQVRNELTNIFASAIESHKTKPGLVSPKLSLGETIKESWSTLVGQLQNIESNIKKLSQKVKVNTQATLNKIQFTLLKFTAFSPAAAVQNQEKETINPLTVQETEKGILSQFPQSIESAKLSLAKEESIEVSAKLSLAEMQEELDDLLEMADIVDQEVTELIEEELSQEENKLEEDLTEDDEEEIIKEEVVQDEEENIGAEEDEQLEEEAELASGEDQSSQNQAVLCEKIGTPSKNKVIFNEIAWMGTDVSANHEWIELKNISGKQINLNRWQLLDKDDRIRIIFGEEIIKVNSFYLLERTDDETVPNVLANLIYTGSLNNSNEILYLFDENCQLQEQVGSLIDWPFGDNSSKRTMERKTDLNWQTSADPGGTPKSNNSTGYVPYYGRGGGDSSPPASSEEVSPLPEILITEVQIETASSTDYDFIELYNPTSESVDISGFQLKKKTSTGNDYSVRVLPENNTITFQGYFLWANSDYASSTQITASATSSQTLAKNNSIILLSSDGKAIDAVAWGTSTNPFVEGSSFTENPEEDQSLGRKWVTVTQSYSDTDNNQDDFEIQEPTPGSQNQTPEPEPENQSQEPLLTVIINEIAWMGTGATNSSDEWIELYNNGTSTVDLTGWTLRAEDGIPLITFSTSSISANDFYLLERTDDQTISDISSDQIYTGALGNSGEKLELRDANNNLIDLLDCSSGWFAGTTTNNYISMERVNASASSSDSSNWSSNNLITRQGLDVDGNNINGTPKAENSVAKSETQVFGLAFVEFDKITFTDLGNPYIVNNNLTVPEGKILSVEPGVTLKFQQQRGLVINGTFLAQGEENNKITFAPLVESNYWSSIYFSSSSQDSILDNCLIKNSGQNPDNLAIKIDSTSVTFKNSKIKNTTVQVLKLINSSSTIENLTIEKNSTGKAIEILGGSPEIRNSTITDTYAGIFVEQGSQAVIEGNYFEGIDYPLGPIYVNGAQPILKDNNGASNSLNGIYLNGTVSNDWQLHKNEIPYVIANLIVADNKTLKIKPGAVIQLVPTSGKIEVNGILEAIGEENNEISFISSDSSSKWDTIRFTSQTAISTLEHVIVKYGGKSSAPTKGALSVDNARVELRHLSFDENYYSLYFKNASSSIISDSEFMNCQRGILIEGDCSGMVNLSLNCACNFANPSFPCLATTSSICQ